MEITTSTCRNCSCSITQEGVELYDNLCPGCVERAEPTFTGYRTAEDAMRETWAQSKPMRTLYVSKSATCKDAAQESRVIAYLYDNFWIAAEEEPTTDDLDCYYPDGYFIVNGYDVAGWTAETQAARMGSGLIGAKVVR